jgi:hypothetical protein
VSVSPHTREFKDLAPGDCFAWRNWYFIKLSTPVVIKWSGMNALAVELGCGEPRAFQPEEPVTYLPNARIETEGL